ncbi:MAG: hypothetical protein E6L04_04240 [Thaumarchaeota archaeon]|nr:MAG: hypothetical protein E6L04_04240 [Nitrososphaerota archaeon]
MDTSRPPNSRLDPETRTVNTLAEILKSVQGKITIDVQDKQVLSVSLEGNRVVLDVSDASIFGTAESDSSIGLFDGLKTAKKLGETLNSKGITLSILRKGKKALSLGRDAKPTLSTLVTRTDDIQVDSVRQVTKLGKDVKDGRKRTKKTR